MAVFEGFLEKSIIEKKRKKCEEELHDKKKENTLNSPTILVESPEKKRFKNPAETEMQEQAAPAETAKKANKRNEQRKRSRLKQKLESRYGGPLPVPFKDANADDKESFPSIITARNCELVWNNDPFQGEILIHHKEVIERILHSEKMLKFSANKTINKTIGFVDYISREGHHCTLVAVSGLGKNTDPKNPGFILDNLLQAELSIVSANYPNRKFLYISNVSAEAAAVIKQLKMQHKKQGANPEYFCAEDKLAAEILKKNTITIESEHYFAIKTPTRVNKIPSCQSCQAMKAEYESRRSEFKPFTSSPEKAITFFGKKRLSQSAEQLNTVKCSLSFQSSCSVET